MSPGDPSRLGIGFLARVAATVWRALSGTRRPARGIPRATRPTTAATHAIGSLLDLYEQAGADMPLFGTAIAMAADIAYDNDEALHAGDIPKVIDLVEVRIAQVFNTDPERGSDITDLLHAAPVALITTVLNLALAVDTTPRANNR